MTIISYHGDQPCTSLLKDPPTRNALGQSSEPAVPTEQATTPRPSQNIKNLDSKERVSLAFRPGSLLSLGPRSDFGCKVMKISCRGRKHALE